MLICITNRKLCKDDFYNRIHQLAQGKPHAILLREKDLLLSDYENMSRKVKEICKLNQIPLIINQNITVAAKLRIHRIHLSMADLRLNKNKVQDFIVGASVHSLSEALEAERLGASYIIAGHIFPTACKKNVPPRGLPFLKEICTSVSIPVYAIGGISKKRVRDVLETGVQGVCVMSESMTCTNPYSFVKDFGQLEV